MVILDSVVSLELPFLLYLKHVYQTSICCVLRLRVVLWNDLPIFYQGQLSPKCTQIYAWPRKDDTFETMLSLIQNFPLIKECRPGPKSIIYLNMLPPIRQIASNNVKASLLKP